MPVDQWNLPGLVPSRQLARTRNDGFRLARLRHYRTGTVGNYMPTAQRLACLPLPEQLCLPLGYIPVLTIGPYTIHRQRVHDFPDPIFRGAHPCPSCLMRYGCGSGGGIATCGAQINPSPVQGAHGITTRRAHADCLNTDAAWNRTDVSIHGVP